jgi:uncharacterized protein (TIGR03435 family)
MKRTGVWTVIPEAKMLRKILTGAWIVFSALGWRVLPAQQLRTFEAAAVRPYKGQGQHHLSGGPGTGDPGRINYSNMTLAEIIRRAYDVRDYQIKGDPAWLDSEHYEIVAKVPEGASKDDLRVMLQSLLEERFKLAVHREKQEGRYYDLLVDKGGAKLKVPASVPEHGTVEVDSSGNMQFPAGPLGRPVTLGGKNAILMVSSGRVLLLGNSRPVSALAEALTRCMDGPVNDLTGLNGEYDFQLDFAAPPGMKVGPMGPPGQCPTCSSDAEPPLTVFQSVRDKLGLKLEPKRGPIDLLVIDRVEKIPAEN